MMVKKVEYVSFHKCVNTLHFATQYYYIVQTKSNRNYLSDQKAQKKKNESNKGDTRSVKKKQRQINLFRLLANFLTNRFHFAVRLCSHR